MKRLSTIKVALSNRNWKLISPRVYKVNNEVYKRYKDNNEAKKHYLLYNGFPYHVHPSRVKGSYLIYKYVKGDLLNNHFNKKTRNTKLLLSRLGRVLAKIHFSNKAKKLVNYHKICARRNIYPKKEVFHNQKSTSYYSKIHGDAHARNLIVKKNNSLVFIDRMRGQGDVLFDFPVLLSLLCSSVLKKDPFYLDLSKNFLDGYYSIAPNNKLFHKGFILNMINFSYLSPKFSKKIPEWRIGKRIANQLANHEDIFEFISHLRKYKSYQK